MINFSDLKIRNKLRILSLLSILSLILLGLISNYFYNTGKALSLIINAERVHNNTFQEGIEDFYRFQITSEKDWFDRAIVNMETANQMAYTFGTIDQIMQMPENEYIDLLYDNYKIAYHYDRDNGYLMASRVKLLLILKPQELLEAQQIALNGYELGTKIENNLKRHNSDFQVDSWNSINEDLVQMRTFYSDFAVAISSLNNFANNLLYIGIALIVILLVLVIVSIATLISSSITVPVHEMVQKFGVIARGNLNTELSINTKNEIGELANSFRNIQNGLRDVIDYTKKVASGDYGSEIKPRSDEDDLSIALNKMVEKLKDSYEKAEKDSWFKTGINTLNKKLSGNQQLEDISKQALSFMMDFLHSQLGSIHLYNQEYQYLKLLCAFGIETKKLKGRIKLNEGIIGQVASKKKTIIFNDIPDDLYITYSSTGEFVPRQIVVAPLVFNETLIGVIELASIHVFTELELQFLKQVSEIIAINLNSSENILKTNELLKKTQDQASELQVQQEELRVANEELVEHTKVLTENEKKLQVQQEELRVANEELEERTRQLEIQKEDISIKNDELTDTRDMLELKAKELQLASQYKSEFLANMSHELRTPLNSLLILSNILSNNKKGNLTEEQVQSAKIIHKSGTDLLHLINEVLDLSKIEAGKMSLEINGVSTLELKDEILMSFNATAEDKNLSFQVFIDEEFPQQITTDRYRLMQILKNLLSNAFKFTSEGSILVDFILPQKSTVFQSPDLNHENACCVKVSDTGVGIPPEKLDAIFEAFQQADGSISRKFGGTGLGLSISRELIRMLGGEIQLESKINEGSAFFVYLPKQIVSEPIVSSEKIIKPVAENEVKTDKKQAKKVTQQTVLVPFIEDDRNESLSERTVLIIHPIKQQAEKYLQQARAKDYHAIVAATIHDGILLAEKYHPKAVMLAVEYANSKNADYLELKKHRMIGRLPVHVITPIDYNESVEHTNELKTLEAIEFTEALKSLEGHFTSPLKKMLIIEDDKVTRNIIREMLSELNIEIEEAQLAGEAYEILTNDKFDCIILDLGLPDFSGIELLEKLKLKNIAIPKVIVYTGMEMSKEEIRELNNFTDTIILKGIKSDERLMDEVTLFLHQVSKTIPNVKAKPAKENDEALFKGKKILVVDDDIRNVFALGKMLEERDIEVIDAENGQVAVDLLKKDNTIDLVLMDVMMPVMDGYEAMKIIRNTPVISKIPIICLTAKAMKEDHENAIKNGANDYLSKPLNEEKLFSMLKIWLYKNN